MVSKRLEARLPAIAIDDRTVLNIKNDEQMVLDLLCQEHILIVQGTAFNWPNPDHFRLVFLPRREEFKSALLKLRRFLSAFSQ